MARTVRVSMIGALLMALATGCGSQQATQKESGPATTKPTATLPGTTTKTPTNETSPTTSGPFVGTCPKAIAANCVPGRRYEGFSIVCVGHGDVQTARTPTQADLRHPPQGKLSPPPTQVFLRMLPNGKARGICVWGRNPLLQAANN